jgi:hypothetical protein
LYTVTKSAASFDARVVVRALRFERGSPDQLIVAIGTHTRPVSQTDAFRHGGRCRRGNVLLHLGKEARRLDHADERLLGFRRRGTRRSGSGAFDRRRLERDLRGVLALHHRAYAGGGGETLDLLPPTTGFVTVHVRLGVFGTSIGNTSGYPFHAGVRPEFSDENSQPAGDFTDPSTRP